MAKVSDALSLFCCVMALLMPSAIGLNRCRVPCVEDADGESCDNGICGSKRYTRERFVALCTDSCRQATGSRSAMTECLADPASGLTPREQQRVQESVAFLISASCRFSRAISRSEKTDSANEGGVEEQSIDTMDSRGESALDGDRDLEEEDEDENTAEEGLKKMGAEELAEAPVAMKEAMLVIMKNMTDEVAKTSTVMAKSPVETKTNQKEDGTPVDEGGAVGAKTATADDAGVEMDQNLKAILEKELNQATDEQMKEALEEDMEGAVDTIPESPAPGR